MGLPNKQLAGAEPSRSYKWWIALMVLLVCPTGARGQSWNWTYESVDSSAKFTSLAVDHDGNVHLSYAGNGGSVLKYAFRAATTNRWFTMELDKQLQQFATNLALDAQGHPHICYTPRELKYAQWDGQQWSVQSIAPGSGTMEYNCSVVVGSDNTPHMLWYQTRIADGTNYYHLKYAILKEGVWLAKTVDFDREDGKWNSMVLDQQGNPHIIYSVFQPGDLKSAYWDGKDWVFQAGISQTGLLSAGMGTSLAINSQQQLECTFYESPLDRQTTDGNGTLKFARLNGTTWSVETVDTALQGRSWVGYRSSLVLDRDGLPHISYEDGGSLKHAYFDGARWHVQVIAPRGADVYLYSSMAMGPDGTLYISYGDPQDGSLKVAIGRRAAPAATTSTAVQQGK